METHHTYLREVLPRLDVQFDKVVEVHAERHPELRQMQDVFRRQWAELVLHLVREEQVLFPFIKQLEAMASLPRIYRGSVDYPIRVMEHEHDSTGSALKSLRKLSGGFAAPPDACPTYRALLHGLAELEADLHRHIHKENNILFPKASALEASLREGKAAPSPSSGESPRRISYDNSKIAVARITGGRKRKVTAEFLRLKCHHLFDSHFCLVRRPNEKGHVEYPDQGTPAATSWSRSPPCAAAWSRSTPPRARAAARTSAGGSGVSPRSRRTLLEEERPALLACPARHSWSPGSSSGPLMVLLSLLPVGLMQTWASVEHGTWYARSAEFMQTPTMDTLRWLRVVGDTIFAVGVVAPGWFVLGLKTGWSIAPGPDAVALEFP